MGADSATDKNQQFTFPLEYLNSIDTGSLPPHTLNLKIGCPIMLLRNLDSSSGLCNGTRLIVKTLHRIVIAANITTGSAIGEIVFIPKIKLISFDTDAVAFKRRQFPVRLAFTLTINKAQGQNFDKIGLYLLKPVFGHG